MRSALFTFRMVPAISGVLARRGIAIRELLEEVGLPTEVRPELTAPLARIQALVDAAAARLDDPLFGMTLAAMVPDGAFGVVEFLIRSAPTIEAGLAVLCEMAPLINPIGEFRVVETPDGGAALHYNILAQRDTLGCQLNEYTIALIVRQLGATTGGAIPLASAWFSHARPEHAQAVASRLGTSVKFQAADCGIAIARDVLARTPRMADAALFAFLLAQARAQLADVGTHDVVSQVIRAIELRLAHGDLGVGAIAAAMATTARSLQRHLADAGTSYRDVLAHVRRRRRAELSRAGLAEAAIAPRLGFADASSMRRSLDE